MKKKHFLFAALFFAALAFGFVGCENPDSESGISIEKPGDDSTSDKPSTPEKPTLIATGDVTDLTENSATFWGRLNADTLWALPNVKWGVEYAYDREAVSQHKHQETTKVNCTAGLQGANMDEFSVTIDGLLRSQTIYYSAYILINDMKYVYGELDSVHIVKLTVKSNSTYGTVTGSGTYDHGAEATITATPNRGVYFVKWNDENTDNSRVVTVTSDMTYTATFVAVPNGSENGYEWVDLGLPSGLKWATCNVGATKPEKYGKYYAWGETELKNIYDWSTYKWCNGSKYTLTKYNLESDYGTVDNKTVLELADDAARTNWGGAWRMPTDAEWTELRNNCTWIWTDDYNGTGVAGRIVASKINGNSIFLPAAGCYSGVNLYGAGGYWSSSLGTDDPGCAWSVYFDWDNVGRYYSFGRDCGQSVRPVLGE